MKNKKGKIILIFLLIFILVGLGLFIYFKTDLIRKSEVIENKPVSLDTINGYDYRLEDRDTTLYKEKFKELKTLLASDSINYEEYAKLVGEMYIIDLYTINNKLNKYDVGSVEFVYPSIRDNFELKVKDTLYKFVEDNTTGKRTQKLPEISSIEVENITTESYQVENEKKDGYLLELSWDYLEDLDYDKKATLKLILVDKNIYVIEHK